MKNSLSKSRIIKSVVKGIVVPILTTTLLLTTITIPAYAAKDDYLTEEVPSYLNPHSGDPNATSGIVLKTYNELSSLGNKRLGTTYSKLTTTGSYENPSMLPSFIADESDTALKVLEKNCPQNYTKYVTPEVQMYQTLGWGEPGDDAKKKAEAEENGIATLDTYIRLSSTSKDSDIPAKRYRALYIMSLCSAHAFTWQCAAADCSA